MQIVTVCEVCTTPKTWPEDQERWLLINVAIKCEFCHQFSKVPLELKQEIRKAFSERGN